MRVAEADILILPGLGNSEPEHWQSRWLRKLSTARKVEQENWSLPRRAAWQEAIEREIAASDRKIIAIAHSLGVIAFLHAALRHSDRIAGAFLVTPPSDDVLRDHPAVDSKFLPAPRQRLAFPAVMVGSTNDPYAPGPFARELAQDLGATYLDAGAAGHINVASGHGPWPEGSMAFAHFLAKL
jgi:uncharacterized protein